MLEKDKCEQLYKKIVLQRELYTLDEVESYSHALYGISFDLDGNIEACTMVLDDNDVYGMIYKAKQMKLSDLWSTLVLYTQGWAAPYSNEHQRPSEHPEAKRVQLICVASKSQSNIESILCLDNDENNLSYDVSGKGKLSEALTYLYSKDEVIYDNFNGSSYYI